MPRQPNVGDTINFFNATDPTDPHPAPGIVDAANGNAIDCTITLADNSTRQETNVNAYDPTAINLRYWEPGDLPLDAL